MLIRYIFGPRAGETEHVDRVSAKPLILAQIAEAVNPDDLKDPNEGTVHAENETYRLPQPGDWKGFPTTWSVNIEHHEDGRQNLAIVRVVKRGSLSDSVSCAFHPDTVHDRHDSTGMLFCSAFGCPVPREILDQYRQMWKDMKALRATEVKRPVPATLDAKADKSAIERGVGESSASGVIQGQQLAGRAGAGLYPERGKLKANTPANTTERNGLTNEAPGTVIWEK